MPRNKKNVYFVCHRKNQEHMLITIKRGAYVGMRTSIISKNSGGGVHNYPSYRIAVKTGRNNFVLRYFRNEVSAA